LATPYDRSGRDDLAASSRLFGEPLEKPHEVDHRGIYLKFVLRALYGADYRRRGAKLLHVDASRMSSMLTGGRRVSRRIVQRLEHALRDRARHRRRELAAAALAVEAAFAVEQAALAECPGMVSTLARLASAATRVDGRERSRETGRFVPRVQRKAPLLREPGAARKKEMALR
jgi:hypothetical protein